MPKEGHYINRSSWLRASMLGANDGIISSASLLVGIASAGMSQDNIILTGSAALIAGALSMATGEYVSVSAQADVERADLERERIALIEDPDYELGELAEGLEQRGVASDLAIQVAQQMTEYDALGAHAREELGMYGLAGQANPVEAAVASAVAFALGAALPLSAAILAPLGAKVAVIAVITLVALVLLGSIGARLGGAPVRPGVMRVVSWGAATMTVTALLGRLFGGSF